MILRRPACYFASVLPRDHVRTSNDVFHNTISSFAHSQLRPRHVSFVPGPLESRKRAAKRRMVEVAPARTNAPLDSVFWEECGAGFERQVWRWQEPRPRPIADPKSKSHKVNNSLPFWLSDSQDCLVDNQSNKHELSSPNMLNSLLGNSQRGNSVLDIESIFLSRVRKCRDLEDIRSVGRELSINFYQAPRYSRLAFKQLLASSYHEDTVFNFLTDLSLNPPEASNLRQLLDVYADITWVGPNIATLKSWASQQIRLGVMTANDIDLLINSIPHFYQPENIGLVQDFCITIFKSIASLGEYVANLHSKTLNSLLKSLSLCSLTSEAEQIGFKIIEIANGNQQKEMGPGIASFMKRWILSRPQRKASDPRHFTRTTHKMVETCLQNLPEDVAITVILYASRGVAQVALSCHKNGKELWADALHQWWAVVTAQPTFSKIEKCNEWQAIEGILACNESWALSLYLSTLDDTRQCAFIIRHCFRYDDNGDNQSMIMRDISNHFKSLQENSHNPPFTNLLISIRTCLSVAEAETTARLFSLLRTLELTHQILNIIFFVGQSGHRTQASIVVHEIQECIKLGRYATAIRIYLMCKWVYLEQCPELAEAIIQNPRFLPQHAMELRRTSQDIPIGLTLCGFLDNKEPSLEERRQLVERMALAYAQAPHLYPRVAFRMVYLCYRLQAIERLGPLRPPMIQSLAETGIFRPLEIGQWVSTMKLRWILSHVARVEGEDFAYQIDCLTWTWRDKELRAQNCIREEEKKRSADFHGRPTLKWSNPFRDDLSETFKFTGYDQIRPTSAEVALAVDASGRRIASLDLALRRNRFQAEGVRFALRGNKIQPESLQFAMRGRKPMSGAIKRDSVASVRNHRVQQPTRSYQKTPASSNVMRRTESIEQSPPCSSVDHRPWSYQNIPAPPKRDVAIESSEHQPWSNQIPAPKVRKRDVAIEIIEQLPR